jgi:hypothetical protein
MFINPCFTATVKKAFTLPGIVCYLSLLAFVNLLCLLLAAASEFTDAGMHWILFFENSCTLLKESVLETQSMSYIRIYSSDIFSAAPCIRIRVMPWS